MAISMIGCRDVQVGKGLTPPPLQPQGWGEGDHFLKLELWKLLNIVGIANKKNLNFYYNMLIIDVVIIQMVTIHVLPKNLVFKKICELHICLIQLLVSINVCVMMW